MEDLFELKSKSDVCVYLRTVVSSTMEWDRTSKSVYDRKAARVGSGASNSCMSPRT